MLKILVEGIDPDPVGMDPDIERVFAAIQLTGDEIERKFIEEIEKGEYFDSQRFVDRVGITLDRMYLSTGCKAALCVHHYPDTPLCCIEIGDNALEAIVTYCQEGTILVTNRTYNFSALEDVNVCVCFRGQEYTSLYALEEDMYEE